MGKPYKSWQRIRPLSAPPLDLYSCVVDAALCKRFTEKTRHDIAPNPVWGREDKQKARQRIPNSLHVYTNAANAAPVRVVVVKATKT